MEVFDHEGCRVMIDAQHLPLAISRWEGLLTPEAARHVFGELEKVVAAAHARGEKVWSVVDATATQRPDSTVRKLLFDLTTEIEERYPDTLQFPSHVGLDSAVIRGALTALNWISGGRVKSIAHASLAEALEGTLIDVDRAGVARPASLVPRSYVFGGRRGASA